MLVHLLPSVAFHSYMRHLLLPFRVCFLWGSHKLRPLAALWWYFKLSLRLLQSTAGRCGFLRDQSRCFFTWPSHNLINRWKLHHTLKALKDTKKIITKKIITAQVALSELIFIKETRQTITHIQPPKRTNKLQRESVGKKLSYLVWKSGDWQKEKEKDPDGKVGGCEIVKIKKKGILKGVNKSNELKETERRHQTLLKKSWFGFSSLIV